MSVAPFANAALDSDATITLGAGTSTIDLQALRLDLDGNRYEGALAYTSAPKPSLSGTLATDTLSLAPFMANEPNFADAEHHWTRSGFAITASDLVDLDLRISANHLRIAPFTIDDAAISVMTRGPRTEVALNEGKAYGGTIKGRASIGVQNGALSLRSAGTLSEADLSTLGWDAFGRQVATGLLSGAINIETSGDNPSALMQHLQGWVKGTASDGELSGIDLARTPSRGDAPASGAPVMQMRGGRTPFTTAAFAARLADGTATFEDATLSGPTSAVRLSGSADIGTRHLDVEAVTSPAGRATSPGPTSVVDITGSFDTPIVAPSAKSPFAKWPIDKKPAQSPSRRD